MVDRKEEIRKIVQEEMKAQPQQPAKRPTGVTIIAVIGIIFSLLMILAGISSIFISSLVYTAMTDIDSQVAGLASQLPINQTESQAGGLYGGMFMLLGIISIVVGAVGIVGSILLFKMKKAGMILVVIASIYSLVSGLLQFSVSNLLFAIPWIVVLVYLIKNRKLFA